MVVVPTGKTLPAGTPVRVTESGPAQESLAVAVPKVASLTVVPQDVAPGPVLTVTLLGGVTTGAVVSTTFTVRVTGAAA